MTNQKYRKIKKWFFTFPQSGERSEFWIFSLWPQDAYFLESVCGVKESHESGDPHLHFAVHLKHGISKMQLLTKIKALEPEDWKRIKIDPMKMTVEHMHENYLAKEGVPWIRYFKDPFHKYLKRTDYEAYKIAVAIGCIYDPDLSEGVPESEKGYCNPEDVPVV